MYCSASIQSLQHRRYFLSGYKTKSDLIFIFKCLKLLPLSFSFLGLRYPMESGFSRVHNSIHLLYFQLGSMSRYTQKSFVCLLKSILSYRALAIYLQSPPGATQILTPQIPTEYYNIFPRIYTWFVCWFSSISKMVSYL